MLTGVLEPAAGIRTDVVRVMPTTSVWIPVEGSTTQAGVTSKFDVPLKLMIKIVW